MGLPIFLQECGKYSKRRGGGGVGMDRSRNKCIYSRFALHVEKAIQAVLKTRRVLCASCVWVPASAAILIIILRETNRMSLLTGVNELGCARDEFLFFSQVKKKYIYIHKNKKK